jgi:cytochrome c peroxidase
LDFSNEEYFVALSFQEQHLKSGFLACLALVVSSEATKSNTPSHHKSPKLPSKLYDYVVELPEHYQEAPSRRNRGQADTAIEYDNTPDDNPTTNEGATLGRVLFYDKSLSFNHTVSCASCHKQEFGFADNQKLSVGFNEELTRRHSMGLTNVRFYESGRGFWDDRATSLEAQALMPIQDEVEMGMTLPAVEKRLSGIDYYPKLFKAAFGDSEVTSERIGKALAQFIRSLVSFDSDYDDGRARVSNPAADFPNFSTKENLGKHLFMLPEPRGGLGCIACHTTEAFVNPPRGPINNGLDIETAMDDGAGEVFRPARFSGSFKTPSLRNVAVGAPYMHDGRFESLEEVIDHYDSGVQPHPNLAGRLMDDEGAPKQLNLTSSEKRALVAFLETLTDKKMLRDKKFSDPF